MTDKRTRYQFKLVLLGESAVGKSSIVGRYIHNAFEDSHETTIGAAFFTKILEFDDYIIKFEIWDTAGQERYSSLANMYYRGSQAAIVVYKTELHILSYKLQVCVYVCDCFFFFVLYHISRFFHKSKILGERITKTV